MKLLFTFLFFVFLLSSCSSSEFGDKYFTSYVIVNQSQESFPRLTLRMTGNDHEPLDSLLAGPIAPFDSITIQANLEFVPSGREFTTKLYVWKQIAGKPLVSFGSYDTKNSSGWNRRYVVKSDTILETKFRK